MEKSGKRDLWAMRDGAHDACSRKDAGMSGGIELVMIKKIPQPDWVVIEYMTTQGNFRKCLLNNRDAKEHWARCNDDIKSSYVIRNAEPDDFEGEYHLFSSGININGGMPE